MPAGAEHAAGKRARVLAVLEHDLTAHDDVMYTVRVRPRPVTQTPKRYRDHPASR